MPLYDLSGSELTGHRSATAPPADLAEFWAGTLKQARSAAGPVRIEPVDTGLRLFDTADVTFTGSGGDPVRAWYHRPAAAEDLPVVVQYQGYGGGRGLPHLVPIWVAAGYACLMVDTRGQGSGWSPGDTPDPAGSAPASPGYLTRGILDPQTYYYRRVFTDAVRAVECVRDLPGADAGRIAVTGRSQGGGMSIAAAALADGVRAAMPDVPFLSDFRRAAEITPQPPFTEIAGYLKVHRDRVEQVFRTLSYFDVSVLAPRASAPALFSVALMDTICPPSTVYAAYNAYGGAKEIRSYPFNDHEGGAEYHEAEQLRWLAGVLPLD